MPLLPTNDPFYAIAVLCGIGLDNTISHRTVA